MDEVERILSTLRDVESGGDYRAQGKNGEVGAYQFMPDTWRDWSQQYIKANNLPHSRLPLSPEWQDKVAGWKVNELLQQGLNPQQVASVWNSGSPEWQGKRGVNPQGVPYDVPAYVDKFTKKYKGTRSLFDTLFSPSEAEAAEIRWPGEETATTGIPIANQPPAQGTTQGAEIRWPDAEPSQPGLATPEIDQVKANLPEWARNHPSVHKALVTAYQALEPTVDVAGMTGGAVLGAPAGPVGGVVGAGMGYAAVQPFKEAAKGALGLPSEQPQTIGDAALKSAEDVGKGAMFEMGGGIIGKGVSALGSGVNALKGAVGDFARKTIGGVENPVVGAPAKQVYEDFQNAGVTPMAGAVSGNKAIQGAEQALSRMPGSSKIMQEATNKALRELGGESERIAGEFSPDVLPSKESLGEFTLSKAAEVGSRFKSAANKVYQVVDARLGNAPSDAANVTQWVNQTASKLSPAASESFKKSVAPYLDPLKADAEAGALNFRSLRYWRTKIGEKLGNPLVADTDSASRGVLKQLENQLTADMETAAQAQGPEGLKLFKSVDEWYSKQKDIMGRIENLVKSGDVQKIGNAISNPAASSETLKALRRKVKNEDWDVLSGTVFGQLGKAKPGAQGVEGDIFSPATFLTNWSKLSPEAKQTLFGGTRYTGLRSEIDRLARVSAAMKDAASMANTSNTASSALWMRLMNSPGSAIAGAGGYALAGFPGSIAGVGASMVTPYVAAKKLFTNPEFVRWLANSGRGLLNNPQMTDETVPKMVGRLVMVAKRNPDIAEDVYHYIRGLSGEQEGKE